jgi:hypothetical protein
MAEMDAQIAKLKGRGARPSKPVQGPVFSYEAVI